MSTTSPSSARLATSPGSRPGPSPDTAHQVAMPAAARNANGNTSPAIRNPPPITIGQAIRRATTIATIAPVDRVGRGGSGSPSPGSTGTRISAAT